MQWTKLATRQFLSTQNIVFLIEINTVKFAYT